MGIYLHCFDPSRSASNLKINPLGSVLQIFSSHSLSSSLCLTEHALSLVPSCELEFGIPASIKVLRADFALFLFVSKKRPKYSFHWRVRAKLWDNIGWKILFSQKQKTKGFGKHDFNLSASWLFAERDRLEPVYCSQYKFEKLIGCENVCEAVSCSTSHQTQSF